MNNSVSNRAYLIESIKEELIGPSTKGKLIDCSGPLDFKEKSDSYGPWKQESTGEEILQRERPTNRYGAGILFPLGIAGDAPLNTDQGAGEDEQELGEVVLDDPRGNQEDKLIDRPGLAEDDDHDFDISGVNAFRQNSMGISFLAEILDGSELIVEVTAGRYERKTVRVEGKDRVWWLRKKITLRACFDSTQLYVDGLQRIRPKTTDAENVDGLDLRVEAYSRNYDGIVQGGNSDSVRMLTVCLLNRTIPGSYIDEQCIFQSWFRCVVATSDGSSAVLPYPSQSSDDSIDDEELNSLTLLFRKFETFGVGHGCSADWNTLDGSDRVSFLTAEAMPECEVPSITPDIFKSDQTPLQVSMRALAGLTEGDDGLASLEELVGLYGSWIDQQKTRGDIPTEHNETAIRHMNACSDVLMRMEDGLNYLKTDKLALEAFRLANRAVLLQQLSAGGEKRLLRYNKEAQRMEFLEPFKAPDLGQIPPGRGSWRPFQIAFLLTCLKSTADPFANDRDNVELLWFPTGGGKTEAYLGLTAFSIFLRRLRDRDDTGTNVVMRYTLRLLTSQQFQRASALICAMEVIRRENADRLGSVPFAIGLWLGGGTTPNTSQQAVNIYNRMLKGQFVNSSFAVLQCPWCRAAVGPHEEGPKDAAKVFGYKREGNEVVIACEDSECPFYRRLPLYVVDEYIYESRPDLVIGTVDKFAAVTWRSEVRNLFGLDSGGNRAVSPPSLIIQDELHLISGPLGSMVGIYEPLIEELCTDRRNGNRIRPKIVSSTATIRRYEQQIRSLYGRHDSSLFPPPGLDASDSFFSSFARDENQMLLPGKKFVGVYAPNLPSMQTAQVRTFSSLLQSANDLPEEDRDPWWTLVAFFNNLRELGNSLSLLQHDIPSHLAAIFMRSDKGVERRTARNYNELTGRLRDQEVPEALERLNVPYGSKDFSALDVCLASNIIEVGIDIERLALMVVVGQPKTTSQYIQVTGRVGRRWAESPGLIVTLYGVGRPRDRSHFEKFRSYHERLYASVEPTSVTPFAPPVLSRALHACLIGFVRQFGSIEEIRNPRPFPQDLSDRFKQLLLERVADVEPEELDNFEINFDKLVRNWQTLDREEWGRAGGIPGQNDMLTASGSYIPNELYKLVWPTPTSLRNVDAECEMAITDNYTLEAISDA